ncbi:peptidase M48 [candidate division KSB3 bacterium]|uniref:Peptidase M48 n=1 Tax=candidate division KSB3 bacterium TaxID=2044937 RepID=A0A2G6E7W3_9BACT|nr:MAG: peptidase M48 [candidate division KSB3 bacterium]PIE30288.1 MAG: peptidase M48 [candidate division KSB3 bacterium]
MNKHTIIYRRTGQWAVLLLVLSLLAAACATVPITGRSQLRIIPDSEMLAMSFQQYDEFLQEHTLSRDSRDTQLVQRVGNNIAHAVEQFFRENNMEEEIQNYSWEFNLVESDEINAWCMPGGKVVVYTGILPSTQDETGLAVVMGHEIAHAIAKHGAERMSQGLLVELGGAALSAALQQYPTRTQELWMTAFGIGAQLGVMLPYSRTQETEADRLGLIFMTMAGYDPHQAIDFWERMSHAGGAKPPEIISTHPSDTTRIRNIEHFLPEALSYSR